MVEILRKEFKEDPVYKKLHEVIKRNHVVAEHTKKVLIENKHIKDFCEESRAFAILPDTPSIFIHYDVASWFHEPDNITIKVDSICIYDDFMEYEKARLSGLHSSLPGDADIPGIN